jgi:hypothetical protein
MFGGDGKENIKGVGEQKDEDCKGRNRIGYRYMYMYIII